MNEFKYLQVFEQALEETRNLETVKDWLDYDRTYSYPDHQDCKPAMVQGHIRSQISLVVDEFRKRHNVSFDEWSTVLAHFEDHILFEVNFDYKYKMGKFLDEFNDLTGLDCVYGYSEWNKKEGNVYSVSLPYDSYYCLNGCKPPLLDVDDDYWTLLKQGRYSCLFFSKKITVDEDVLDFAHNGEHMRARGVTCNVVPVVDLTDEYVQGFGYPNVDVLSEYLPSKGNVYVVAFDKARRINRW